MSSIFRSQTWAKAKSSVFQNADRYLLEMVCPIDPRIWDRNFSCFPLHLQGCCSRSSTSRLWNSPFFCISGFLQPFFLQKAGLSPPKEPDGMIFFITLFRYFMFLFYSYHYLSFPFPKGCRLEKRHIVPILCSHS